MIIKSMSRKEPSFSQLINYITRDSSQETRFLEKYDIYHNVFSHKPEEALVELEENARLLPKRKNGVVLYHEILSITKSDEIGIEEQKQALSEIVRRYISERAKENLVFGGLHDEKDNNLHYHLVISANANGVSKRTRLSKAQFAKIQKDLEAHVLENYPQLKQQVAIHKVAERKLSQPGAQLQKRTGQMPKRDEMIAKLTRLFEAGNRAEAANLLQAEGLTFYQRGKTLGVTNLASGKNHRLKTLGMLEAYADFKSRIEESELKMQISQVQKLETEIELKAQQEESQPQSRQVAEKAEQERLAAEEAERLRNEVERQSQLEAEAIRQAEEAARLIRAQETTRQLERQRRTEEQQRQQQAEQAQNEQSERMKRMTSNTQAIDHQARSEPEEQPEAKTGLALMLEQRREQMKKLRNRFSRNKGRSRR